MKIIDFGLARRYHLGWAEWLGPGEGGKVPGNGLGVVL